MNWSNFLQFILGFILGVALLGAGATGVAYLFFTRLSAPPPKPVFSEEKRENPTVPPSQNSPTPPTATATPTGQPTPEGQVTPEEKAMEKPTPTPSPEKKQQEKLEPGTYKARVTWSEGLSLRAEPSTESERVGGAMYDSAVVVIETSSDGRWQKVRLSNGQEGWVRSGNLRKEGE